MSGPANSDPLELVPLPADFLSVDAALKMSLLESTGIRFVLRGVHYWGAGRQTLLVARRDYEDALRVLEQTPRPFLMDPPRAQGDGTREAGYASRRSKLPVVLGALLLAWVVYGVLKARF